MSRWIEHIKEFAKKTNKSYGCALSDPECSASYRRKYGDAKKVPAKTERERMGMEDKDAPAPPPPSPPAAVAVKKSKSKPKVDLVIEEDEPAPLYPVTVLKDGKWTLEMRPFKASDPTKEKEFKVGEELLLSNKKDLVKIIKISPTNITVKFDEKINERPYRMQGGITGYDGNFARTFKGKTSSFKKSSFENRYEPKSIPKNFDYTYSRRSDENA